MTKGNYDYLRADCYCNTCRTKFKAEVEKNKYRCGCGSQDIKVNFIEKVIMKNNKEFNTEKIHG